MPTTPRTAGSRETSTSSLPAVARLLADLDGALGELGCRWYVFGAQAAVAYGRPRMTADVDVTVELGQASKRQLLDHLASAGFPTRLALTASFIEDARLFPLFHEGTTIPVDLLLAGSGLHEAFLDRRRQVDVGGRSVPMLSPEDLIVTKILAGRRKDLEDVRGVILEQGSALQIEPIRDLLTRAQDALGRPGLLRRFDRLWRAKRPGPR